MTLHSTRFIYRPCSKDRVFAENACDEIVVITWPNGCRHVIGGVHLSWHAAEQGKYWRGEARQAAKLLIGAGKGIAWDEQGSIHIIIPQMWVYSAVGVMDGVMKEMEVFNSDIQYGLIAAGIAKFNSGTIELDSSLVSDCPVNLGEIVFPEYKTGYATKEDGTQCSKYMDHSKVEGGVHPQDWKYHDDKFRLPEYPAMQELKKWSFKVTSNGDAFELEFVISPNKIVKFCFTNELTSLLIDITEYEDFLSSDILNDPSLWEVPDGYNLEQTINNFNLRTLIIEAIKYHYHEEEDFNWQTDVKPCVED